MLHDTNDTTAADRAADAINTLVGKNIDYADGYQAAAAKVRGMDATSLVSELSRERRHWAGQLQLAVRALGASPADRGAGALQRAWLELRAALGSPEGEGLIEAVRAAEERMLGYYEVALARAPIPPELVDVLEEHQRVLRESIERLERQDFAGD